MIWAFSPSPVRTACSTQNSLMTGSIPGIAASTKETLELGSAPNSVEAPEKSLDRLDTWAWTSIPMTSSQSCLAPAITFGFGGSKVRSSMDGPGCRVNGLRSRTEPAGRQGQRGQTRSVCGPSGVKLTSSPLAMSSSKMSAMA